MKDFSVKSKIFIFIIYTVFGELLRHSSRDDKHTLGSKQFNTLLRDVMAKYDDQNKICCSLNCHLFRLALFCSKSLSEPWLKGRIRTFLYRLQRTIQTCDIAFSVSGRAHKVFFRVVFLQRSSHLLSYHMHDIYNDPRFLTSKWYPSRLRPLTDFFASWN